MIYVILCWIYITFIFGATGLLVARCFYYLAAKEGKGSPQLPEQAPPITLLLTGGMILTTAIAALLSLWMPLSAGASFIVLLLALLCLLAGKKQALEYVRFYRRQLRNTHWLLLAFFVAYLLVVAQLSVQEPSHHDEGLYYGTTIKWMEEFGTVKGLANINPRIGFNSNWHLLHALFSFRFLHLGNFNDLNGLLLLIILPFSLGGLQGLFKGKSTVMNLMRALMFLPLMAFHFEGSHDFILFNINFLSSPAADLAVCVLLWLCFILLFELDQIRCPLTKGYQALMIMVISVFLVTVKPSAAPVLLAFAGLFFWFLSKRRWQPAAASAAAALFIGGTWVVRNILISGYILFPFSGLDLFHVDWKLPFRHVRWHENAVRVFAINPEYDFSKPLSVPLSTWAPVWFDRLTFIQAVLFLLTIISSVVFFLLFILKTAKKGQSFLKGFAWRTGSIAIAMAGVVFWFLKGPDFRLGYGFTGTVCIFSLALFLQYFLEEKIRYAAYIFCAAFLYILISYDAPLRAEIAKTFFRPPPERRMPESMTEQVLGPGIKIRLVDKDDSWYGPLPIANSYEYNDIKPVLRGSSLKEGFKASIK